MSHRLPPGGAPGHGILFTYAAKPLPWGNGGGDVYSWNPGIAPHRLTKSIDPKVNPQWSPDGTRIAWSMFPPSDCPANATDFETYCSDKFGCVDEVFVARSDGTQPMQVSPVYLDSSHSKGCSRFASWSPDGKQLLIERVSNVDPASFAVLSLKTRAVHPLSLPDFGGGPELAAWGKPGIAYLWTNNRGLFEVRVVSTRTGALTFAVRLRSLTGVAALAWSSSGELAVGDGKRVEIYSSSGRRLAAFAAPLHGRTPAPMMTTLLWSPDGKQLFLSIQVFRAPAAVGYLVDRNGRHWRKIRLPYPRRAWTASSWR